MDKDLKKLFADGEKKKTVGDLLEIVKPNDAHAIAKKWREDGFVSYNEARSTIVLNEGVEIKTTRGSKEVEESEREGSTRTDKED